MGLISGAASGKPDSQGADICKKGLCNPELHLQQLTTNHCPSGGKIPKLYYCARFSLIVLIS
jgi:hypothetical protein